MARQPSYRPLRATSFFDDGRSARPLVAGTVPRGSSLSSGRRTLGIGDWTRLAGVVALLPFAPIGSAAQIGDWSLYEDTLPFEISRSVLERGQERFNIFCAVCHDRAGTGHGMIVERGFTPPPSFHTDLSRG